MAARIIVGSKNVPLSSQAVYNIAHRLVLVELDSSALDRISHGTPKFLQPPPTPQQGTNFLSPEEARATLVVMLSKLLQGEARIHKFLPLFITGILNLNIDVVLPSLDTDLPIAMEMVSAVYEFKQFLTDKNVQSERIRNGSLLELQEWLNGKEAGDAGITAEELDALTLIAAASVGIAALSIYPSSSISVIADSVAALSCEALQANTQPFDAECFNQNFSHKCEVDVASDLRVLLMGSKVVNPRKEAVEGDFISEIPVIHGAFREAAKQVSSRLRVELNRPAICSKKGSSADMSSAKSSSLLDVLVSYFGNLWRLVTYSCERTRKMLRTLPDMDDIVDAQTIDEFERNFESDLHSVKESVGMACRMAFMESKSPGVLFSRVAFEVIQKAQKALAWEAAAAVKLLLVREKISQGRSKGSQEEVSGNSKDTQKGKEGTEKKKKGSQEVTIGKGTGVMKQFLLDVFQGSSLGASNGAASFLLEKQFVDVLEGFFKPTHPSLEILLESVKSVIESNETRRLPKVPKGTRDFLPEQMAIREKAFGIIAGVFKRHGAVALDTPVFELRETLMGKYGEDSKLIYDLADQGGEILSLRYDLTVPFARFLATQKLSNMKRYHIARVYRRDNPAKGRYREFYQCDFDIAGQYQPMVADFEVIKVLTTLLDELNIGDYEVKLNHRKLLDGMLELCGVPESKFRTICSSIDKLDKQSWEHVCKEMVEEKGLPTETANKIGELVQKKGAPLELLQQLQHENSPFVKHAGSSSTLEELALLFKYLKASNCLDRILFDLSLARGLDYYTGVIYEAVFKGSTQVGSIAAGGRYDKLVGMFSGKEVPAVGVSLGIERVFTIMEQLEKERKNKIRATQTQVLVVVLGDGLTDVAIQLVSELWDAKLEAEFVCTPAKRVQKSVDSALASGIPWMVIVGQDELDKGQVQLKNLELNKKEYILRVNMVKELQTRIQALENITK